MKLLGGFDATKIGLFIFVGYIGVIVFTKLLETFGVIAPKANLGVGFIFIGAGMGMLLVYTVIVKKGLSLSFNEILVMGLLAGIVIVILAFLPTLAPGSFEASLTQFRIVIQNMIG